MFPGDGPDTALARALLDLGVERGLLRTALDEVRRSQGGVNLGSLLAGRGWVPADALGRAAETLRQGVRPLAAVPQLGSYRLVRELARGGMGAVYEAEQVETGGRVALKRILPELLEGLDAEALTRFRREAELSARLRAPGIVPVHAADLEGPHPYLVQAFFAGGSLQERVAEGGPLGPDEARRLGIRLARALTHAHAQGVVHRDLKPQNVLFDERGEAAITDFGLAAARGQGLTLTQSGEILGSPAYMPPEQIADARSADARSDVYALGAILYFALSGQAPFRGQNVFEVLHRVLQVEPVPLVEWAPGVPGDLVGVIQRAMAKAPGRRFADAEALAQALEQPPPAKARPSPWSWAALVLALGAGLVVAWQARPDPRPAATPSPAARDTLPRADPDVRPERTPLLAQLEARLLDGERGLEPAGLDASERGCFEALQAALEGDLERADRLLLSDDVEAIPQRARLSALGVLREAQERLRTWSNPACHVWAWPTARQLVESVRKLDSRAGGLQAAAVQAVQRAFAHYLMFCPSLEFLEVMRQTNGLERVLALSEGGAARCALLAALWRRLDQPEHAELARTLQEPTLQELLGGEPPPQRALLPTEAFCLSLVLVRQPTLRGPWRDVGLALGDRVLGELSERAFVSRFADMGAVLSRDLMVRYRERSFEAFAEGADGQPDLERALELARSLVDFSDSLQAGITYIMGGQVDRAARALAEARQHLKLAEDPVFADQERKDLDYLQAELALCRGEVVEAAATLATLFEFGERGLEGADYALAAEVFTLQYHVHQRLEGSPDPGLLEERTLSGRRTIGVPWREPAYTRRLTEDPEAWWPGKRD